jgi:hypothetical protein
MMLRRLAFALIAAFALLSTAGPVAAAEAGSPTLVATYWDGFLEHWTGVFQKQNGVVMAALLIGAVCLFIITRGKWKK